MIHSTETIFPVPRESETEKENSRENELARLVDSGNTRELLRFLTEDDSDPFSRVEKKTRETTEKKSRGKKNGARTEDEIRRHWKNIDNFIRREYGGVYPAALEKHLANIETWHNRGIAREYAVRSIMTTWTYAGEIFRAKLGMMNYTPIFYKDRTDILPFTFDPAFFARPGLRVQKNARKFLVKILHAGIDRVVSSQYTDTFPSMLSLFADGENEFVTVCKIDTAGNWQEFACMNRVSWIRMGGARAARNWRVVKKYPDRYDIVSTAVFTDRAISSSYLAPNDLELCKNTDAHPRIVRVPRFALAPRGLEIIKLCKSRGKNSSWKSWMKNPVTYFAHVSETPAQFTAHKKALQVFTRETETETEITRVYNETRRIENENPSVWDADHPGWG